MTRQAKPAARPSRQRHTFQIKTLSLAIAVCLGTVAPAALANPTGAAVVNGSATFDTQGNTLTVTNSNGAIINWQQFNVGANETTRFVQPNAQSSVLNRVVGGNPSQILGTMQSNGQVFLLNPNGILFGKSAVIDMPGLIASTLNLSDSDFQARRFNFSGGGFGPLVNQGKISTSLGGSVMLVGSEVRNEGIITTPQGHVILAAGNSVSLSDTAGPEISVTVTASGNKAVNLGEINAAGGKIDIFGALIEQQGVLRADSASVDEQGRIILKATDSTTVSGTISATNSAGSGGTIEVLGKDVTLTGMARLDASGATGGGTVLVGGDWQGKNAAIANAQTATMESGSVIKADATSNGNGGKVVLWSDDTTVFLGNIFARGGANGGDGGQVETSGHQHLGLGGSVNTLAPKGKAGTWLLDPAVLCIDTIAYPNVGACSGAYDVTAHGGNYMTDTLAIGFLDSQLLTTNVNIAATDYIAVLPNGGTYTASSSIPGGRTLDVNAPHIYLNGTLDFSTNNVPITINLNATGISSSFPTKPNLLLDNGARLLFPSSGFSSVTVLTDSIEFGNGAQINMPLSSSGSVQIDGNGTNQLFFKNRGGSITAPYLGLTFYDLNDNSNTIPLNLNVNSLNVQTFQPGPFQLGIDNCPTGPCVGDVTKTFNGSIPVIDFFFSGGDIHWVGPLTLPSSTVKFHVGTPGNLWIKSAVDLGLQDLFLSGQNILVDGALSNSGSILLSSSNSVSINQAVTAGTQFAAYGTHIDLYNTVTAKGSGLSSLNSYWGVTDGNYVQAFFGIASGSSAGTNMLVNHVGLGAISTPNGRWLVDLPNGATADMQGLGTGPLTYTELTNQGIQSTSAETRLSLNTHQFYIGTGSGSTTSPIVDQLVQNQVTTATNPTSPTTTQNNATVVTGSTISAPLTIDATLTVTSSSATTSTGTTTSTTTTSSTTTQTYAVQDAKVVVAKKDNDKSATEVRAEAKKARDDASKAEAEAKKADAEAKRAEAEAKQAEAEAKAAKSPADKAAAKRKIEEKKAEAEAKKAEAEAKKAESEAKTAEAESREALAETKSAPPTVAAAPVVAKQTRAETKQVQAESKQAEAQAKKAEAESKLAAIEAKAVSSPDQKAVAQKTAEAKKIEADAYKTQAQAKKIEAEAKQAEAEAKTAPTPQARALAEKKAETKRVEAEVKKTEAESKQAQAESKQAEAQGKQAEVKAKEAQAEAKRADTEAKTAKTPEQKTAAAEKAEVKKTEAEAHKTEGEARKVEAEGKKVEAEAKRAEAEAKRAEAEAKTAPTPQARATAEKKAETKRVEAEVKKTEAESKQAQAEAKQAEAQGKQSEAKAKEAQAEARQAEADAKAAKTPEQKAAATQKAEVKKTEAEARKTEGEARKAEAEGKKAEADAKKAEADAKKAEADAKQAKAPEQKAAAEKKAEAKRTEAEEKKADAEAKKTESEAKQAQADAKQAEADAKGTKSPGGRAVVEKEAEAKKAEGEQKQAEAGAKKAEAESKKAENGAKKAEAEAKKAEGEGKKAEAEAKKAEGEGKKAEAEAKKSEAEAKKAEAEAKKAEAEAKKAEAEAKKAEAEAKKAEAEAKKAEAEKKAEEVRVAAEKRQEERRVESAKAFAAIATAGANRAALEDLAALRHELKTETLKPALNILKSNPAAADLPPCGAGDSVCVPVAAQQAAGALPPPLVPKVAFLPQIQRKVAVVIGVNKYADSSIPSLDSAVPDAKAVGQQLQEQLGYDVRVVEDASRADIVTSLNKLSQEVGPNDSVTVYYAGHGYQSEKTGTGYWIPADAKASSPANWISNKDISKLLSNIPAKQVMLVSDSCYSGSLTKEQKIAGGAGSLDPSGILAKRSVTVMSSGGEEPVSDEGKEGHSIFAYSFMNALKSVKQVDSGVKLFESVKTEVSRDFPQTPQYGGAVSAGHAPGGDYLLEARSYK